MKHWETHPTYVEGCFGCKISTVRGNTENLAREREGRGPGGDMSNREYVRKMYEDRRAAGLEDPEPENRKAAALAPKRGIVR